MITRSALRRCRSNAGEGATFGPHNRLLGSLRGGFVSGAGGQVCGAMTQGAATGGAGEQPGVAARRPKKPRASRGSWSLDDSGSAAAGGRAHGGIPPGGARGRGDSWGRPVSATGHLAPSLSWRLVPVFVRRIKNWGSNQPPHSQDCRATSSRQHAPRSNAAFLGPGEEQIGARGRAGAGDRRRQHVARQRGAERCRARRGTLAARCEGLNQLAALMGRWPLAPRATAGSGGKWAWRPVLLFRWIQGPPGGGDWAARRPPLAANAAGRTRRRASPGPGAWWRGRG